MISADTLKLPPHSNARKVGDMRECSFYDVERDATHWRWDSVVNGVQMMYEAEQHWHEKTDEFLSKHRKLARGKFEAADK